MPINITQTKWPIEFSYYVIYFWEIDLGNCRIDLIQLLIEIIEVFPELAIVIIF